MSDEIISAEKIKKVPNPIDRHVGSRVRMRRVILGMSSGEARRIFGAHLPAGAEIREGREPDRGQPAAADLAHARRAAGVLFRRRAILRGRGGRAAKPARRRRETPSYVLDFLSTAEGQQLNMAFARIHDPKVRKRIIDLVAALAAEEPGF